MGKTEFSLHSGDYTLQASVAGKPKQLHVRWIRANRKPHAPIYFDLKEAPEYLRMLADFAESVRRAAKK